MTLKLFIIYILLCLFQDCKAVGEEDSTVVKSQSSYFFYIQSGALVGCQGCELRSPAAFTTSIVHGIKIKERYRIGLGTGLDYYDRHRVIPVFVSLSGDIAGKRDKLFVELNYGGTFAKVINDKFESANAEGGAIFSPMVGYRLTADRTRISFAIGYRFQTVTDHYSNQFFNDAFFRENYTESTVQYTYTRFILLLRVGLW